MKGLSKSEKTLLCILAFAIVGYVYFQYIISPTLSKMHSAQTNISNYQNEINELKLLSVQNKKLEENLKEFEAKRNDYADAVPRSDRSAEILRSLKKLADDSSVRLTSLTSGTAVEYTASQNSEGKEQQTKIMAIPVTMNITGEYSNIMTFIKTLEESVRITQSNSIVMAPNANKTGAEAMAMALSCGIFYMEDGAETNNEYDFNSGAYGKDNPFK
jgi:Tfp pilus assembly protein PilO